MRRKIAKRKRREILKHATIIREYWVKHRDWKRKDWAYIVDVKCNGWMICAPGDDELEAYKAALECIETAEREPPFERNDKNENL